MHVCVSLPDACDTCTLWIGSRLCVCVAVCVCWVCCVLLWCLCLCDCGCVCVVCVAVAVWLCGCVTVAMRARAAVYVAPRPGMTEDDITQALADARADQAAYAKAQAEAQRQAELRAHAAQVPRSAAGGMRVPTAPQGSTVQGGVGGDAPSTTDSHRAAKAHADAVYEERRKKNNIVLTV